MSRDFSTHALACEGIIGDGCGGGRWFFIEDEKLFAYDPTNGESMLLLSGIKEARSISKSGCIVSIVCADKLIEVDLKQIQNRS
ncbi:MAG: thiamine biosynthesis protein ThiF [Sulfuricurvum sp.]